MEKYLRFSTAAKVLPLLAKARFFWLRNNESIEAGKQKF
jgi:hypothetical protein